MSATPKKLTKDAIAEALCEIRFECEESVSLPEIVVGRLAEFETWRDFKKVRLPVSEIPATIRSQDPSLKNQPVLELREKNGSRLVKIGVNVLSFHRLAPYPGWESFRPEIYSVIDGLFNSFQVFKTTRMGFRYINIFTDKDHGVKNVKDLNYSVKVAGQDLQEPQNLNYRLARSEAHIALVRIASPEFVSEHTGRTIDVVVDVDVFTPEGWSTDDVGDARKWVEAAHTYEKEEFFKLFTEDMITKLVEVE